MTSIENAKLKDVYNKNIDNTVKKISVRFVLDLNLTWMIINKVKNILEKLKKKQIY